MGLEENFLKLKEIENEIKKCTKCPLHKRKKLLLLEL